jgi:hypothetical protein
MASLRLNEAISLLPRNPEPLPSDGFARSASRCTDRGPSFSLGRAPNLSLPSLLEFSQSSAIYHPVRW